MPLYYLIQGPVCDSLMVSQAPSSTSRRSRSPIPRTPPTVQSATASGSGQSRPWPPMRNERPAGRQMILEEAFQKPHPDREVWRQQQRPGPQRTDSQTLGEGPRERPPPDPAREYRIRLADGIIQALREEVGSLGYMAVRGRALTMIPSVNSNTTPLTGKYII